MTLEKNDILIFGATGFTGTRMIPYVAQYSKSQEGKELKWGVAGRSIEKLKEVLKQYEKEIGRPIDEIPTVVANISDTNSLNLMVRQARVIINCSGPYDLYGEPVVKACVEEGTHHVDVSAELQFIEKMQLKYHEKAQQTGAYIISACGYSSIPVDLGINFCQQNFKGTLNSVVGYYRIYEEEPIVPGHLFNNATWGSLIQMVAEASQIKEVREKLFRKAMPLLKPRLQLQMCPHKPEVTSGWAMPLDATDAPVVNRSQRFFYENNAKRPIQYQSYYNFKTLPYLLVAFSIALLVSILTKFSFGINLLLKFPRFFSFGVVGDEGEHPSDKKLENLRCTTILYGKGWKESLSEPDDQYKTEPDSSITVKISGKNPGYGAACICLALAAVTVAREADKMPLKGGVYSPGYAFAETSLIKQLNQNGVTFEVVKKD